MVWTHTTLYTHQQGICLRYLTRQCRAIRYGHIQLYILTSKVSASGILQGSTELYGMDTYSSIYLPARYQPQVSYKAVQSYTVWTHTALYTYQQGICLRYLTRQCLHLFHKLHHIVHIHSTLSGRRTPGPGNLPPAGRYPYCCLSTFIGLKDGGLQLLTRFTARVAFRYGFVQ